MNIANIFGLHIGCKVKCKGQKKTGFVIRVLPDYEDTRKWEIGVQFWNEKKTWNTIHDISITECKLILKPLSKITDEDKAEFQVLYKIKEKVTGFDISSSGAVLVCTEFADFDGDPMDKYDDISYAQLVWLCSKGYDIGIVPDEYKEVEE